MAYGQRVWNLQPEGGFAGDGIEPCRTIRSRLTVDRIIGINLIGTLVVITISVLTYLLGEDYLADIAVVYVVLSFIAVAMLCRIYINLYDRKKEETQDDR